MRIAFTTVGLTLVLAASGASAAPENSVEKVQEQSFPAKPQSTKPSTAPDHTVPAPPYAQPKAPLGDLAKPAAVGPSQNNTADSLPSETPPGATRQTMPSTISAENATLDKTPTTALQFPLTEENRALIAASVAQAPDSPIADKIADLGVAEFLPSEIAPQEFPPVVIEQLPTASRYKYVKQHGTVLIIDPPNMTIVGEIKL